jgi:hypothetical protein
MRLRFPRLSSRAVRRPAALRFSLLSAALPVLLVIYVGAGGRHDEARSPESSKRMAELWEAPADIAARDLYFGPGGRDLAPRPGAAYRVLGLDNKGHSSGYDVVDAQGREWAVKLGEEAQSDVVVSRILWAIGYHQPVTYFVPEWNVSGRSMEKPPPGRFRLSSDHKVIGEWSWTDNPFEDTRPFRGLVVANLVLNNWDFTKENTRIYKMKKKPSGFPARRYVVQDVGGSLGRTKWPIGTRNNVDDFESERLIQGVRDGRVDFTYKARHRLLVKDFGVADVVWACRLLDRLSDSQLDDAFRAAGYPPQIRARYVRKIRAKIREGLTLGNREGRSS